MFNNLKQKVQDQFKLMINSGSLFYTTGIEKGKLFEAYLACFPEESRQYYNCNCCRQFLHHYGDLVIIKDNKLITLWDFVIDVDEFRNIPATLREIVLSKSIEDVFLTNTEHLGTDSNHQQLDSGRIIKWEHFYVNAKELRGTKNWYHGRGETIDSILGKYRTSKQVTKRALDELTTEAITTVQDLIEENNLYRGQDYKTQVNLLSKHKDVYSKLKSDFERDNYAWNWFNEIGGVRNTAIGTLLVDLSEGYDLEDAIKSFELKVAPSNYRRPKALITKSMMDQALKKIEELGVESALYRRHAVKSDIPVDKALYVNRNKQAKTLASVLETEVVTDSTKLKNLQKQTLDDFIKKTLPEAMKVELLVENRHSGNLVNLTSQEDKDAAKIFKWDNDIAWAYVGDVTDSIKEKVKAAGGDVTGYVRISLAWFNYDDLDLHILEPNGNHIYFGNKCSGYTGARLDVDMNAGGGHTRTPVENVVYHTRDKMLPGVYKVQVNNYNRRESIDIGYQVEIECDGVVWKFDNVTGLRSGATDTVAEFTFDTKKGITLNNTTVSNKMNSKEIWGIHTNKFHEVSMIVNSPNCWESTDGKNCHTFLLIDNVKNPEPVRGFYNEYLRSDLYEQRKVFEVLGSKLKIDSSDEQLAGFGFSSTQKNDFIVNVTFANKQQLIKVEI